MAAWSNKETPSDINAQSLIVYRLDTFEDLSLLPVLVAGYGNAMKAAVKACDRHARGPVYVTGTEDKRRAFAVAKRAEVITIGAEFDKRLFGNAYAIVKAAVESGAKSILLADKAQSDSELLRIVCANKGILLLTPMEGDKSLEYWTSLEPESDGPYDDPEWKRCPHCKMYHDAVDVWRDWGRCPSCGELYRLDSFERIGMTFDVDSFVEWDERVEEVDPLGFPDFEGYIEKARKGGLWESVRTGYAAIDGIPFATGIMEPGFMMGSLGYVAGERLARMIERATDGELPVIIFSASGGARMQEGIISLMQMAKVSAALERHARAGLPYFSVLTDPTTGGVTASFAMQGDIILAEPGALIGFAGRRVIQGTIKQELPEDFQTAEFALAHGLIDAIVERKDMRRVLGSLLALHAFAEVDIPLDESDVAESDSESEFKVHEEIPGYLCIESVVSRSSTLRDSVVAGAGAIAAGSAAAVDAIGKTIKGISQAATLGSTMRTRMPEAALAHDVHESESGAPEKGFLLRRSSKSSAWDHVQLARNAHRPTARYYIDQMVDGFIELHGDRAFGDDGAIVAGLGRIGGMAVTVIAEEKGANLKERVARNFGCPEPEGYRKSRRLMEQAQKFGRPIVCLVDTQGAFCGVEAEERGQGNAIAENLMALAGLTVPVVSVILGEGGSGGALALAVADRVAMQEHAIYSVLSPEGFASILWKDSSRASEAADVMKISAADALDMGVVECVLSEGDGPAHKNPEAAAREVERFVTDALHELSALSGEELRAQRYARFRKF